MIQQIKMKKWLATYQGATIYKKQPAWISTLEYNELAAYFDLLGSRPKKVNAKIEKILKTHSVRTVLDLTCGTGPQVLYLAKKSYTVMGSNISPKLLKIAREKRGEKK